MVLVVVCAITGVGWLAYSHYQSSHKAKSSSSVVASSTPSTTSTVKTPVTVQQPTTVANQNVVKIPELGIQITVPDSIKDLTYQTTSGTLNDGAHATMARFSTSSLATTDAKCGASSGPLGVLESVSGQYPTNIQQTALNDYGELIKQFPTFYVSYFSQNAACSANATTQATATQAKVAFTTAESTIQQSN